MDGRVTRRADRLLIPRAGSARRGADDAGDDTQWDLLRADDDPGGDVDPDHEEGPADGRDGERCPVARTDEDTRQVRDDQPDEPDPPETATSTPTRTETGTNRRSADP